MLVVFIERQEQSNSSDVNSVSNSSLEVLNCDFAILGIFIVTTVLLNTTQYREFESGNKFSLKFSDTM